MGKMLRAALNLTSRLTNVRNVLAATVLLLVASWFYPPWNHYGCYVTPSVSHGWFFVFDTQQGENGFGASKIEMRIDSRRLLFVDAVIAAAGGLLALALCKISKHREALGRRFLYLCLAVPAIALACYGVLLMTALAPVVIQLATRESEKVVPSDLDRIVLFDISADSSSEMTRVQGKVRNGLSRPVEHIALRISFHNAGGGLFSFKNAPLFTDGVTVEPGAIVGFWSPAKVDNPPAGCRWSVEVIEAHYVE